MGGKVCRCVESKGPALSDASFKRARPSSYRAYYSHEDLGPESDASRTGCGGSTLLGPRLPDIALTTPGGTLTMLDANNNAVIDGERAPLCPQDVNAQDVISEEGASTRDASPGGPSLQDLLDVKHWQSRVIALIDGISGKTYSYAELRQEVERVAGGLSKLGIAPGVQICVVCPNSPQVISVCLATLTLGASVIMAEPTWDTDTLSEYLISWEPRVVFVSPGHVDAAIRASHVSSSITPVVFGNSKQEVMTWEELVSGAPYVEQKVTNPWNEVAFTFTMGDSGGSPQKGPVNLSHKNIVSNIQQFRESNSMQWRVLDDVVLATVPFHHPLGLIGVVCMSLLQRVTMVTLPHWEVKRVLHACTAHKVRILPLLSGWMGSLATHPDVTKNRLPLPAELVVFGQAPFPEFRHSKVLRQRGVKNILGVYVLCEATAGIAVANTGDLKTVKTLPLPETKIKVVESGTWRELPLGEKGEVMIRGPQVMDVQHNSESVQTGVLDQLGWLKTGDFGRIDIDGNLHILGRLDDVINIDGKQLSLQRVEEVVLRHPAAADVAVVATPFLKAIVVRRQGYPDVSSDEIASFVNKSLSPESRISSVTLVEDLPRTPSGRLMRKRMPPSRLTHTPREN